MATDSSQTPHAVQLSRRWRSVSAGVLLGVLSCAGLPTAHAQPGSIETYKNRTIGAEPPVIEAVLDKDLDALERLWITRRTKFFRTGTHLRSPLMFAVLVGDQKIVRFLLGKDVSLEQQDDAGNTALHYAAGLEKPEILEALLDARAQINAANFNGEVPLLIAARKGRTENVARLLDRGADSTLSDYSARGIREYARESGNRALLRMLKRRGL